MKSPNPPLKLFLHGLPLLLLGLQAAGQHRLAGTAPTYCNPINIDYTYMIYNANSGISYRSGADPAVVGFRGGYYLFVTRSMGYWYSTDLADWVFIHPEKWYFQGSNAPAASNYRDSVLYVAGDPSGSMSILYTDDPLKGDWKATPAILNDLQDPDLFIDSGGQAYMFWGSSNRFPIRGRKLDRGLRFRPAEQVDTLFNLDPLHHGWERFGENNSDTARPGYIEGAWLTRHGNTYYMQYAAPGTEFNVYADGVYTASSPTGPYHYAPNNPVCFKPGGFIDGAGHGSTVKGPGGSWWHFTTMSVGVNIGWERRIGMFPTFFDTGGLMRVNTYFGDYPHYAPSAGDSGRFTGWMLLSYHKPVTASSFLPGHGPGKLVDENIKTFWVAEKNDDRGTIRIDLRDEARVFAVQVNFNDYHADLYGRVRGLYHRYLVQGSRDGRHWFTLVDRTSGYKDTPDDYLALDTPRTARYIRFRSIHVPTPYLSISGLRIFGKGGGAPPAPVTGFRVRRLGDRRDAVATWDADKGSQGYNVLWGIAPGKLYSSWMVYGKDSLSLRCLNSGQSYYFSIESFNANGVSRRSFPVAIR